MKNRLYISFFLFLLIAVWVCIWVLFIGFQDTRGIEQGRGAIVVTSEEGGKKSPISFFQDFSSFTTVLDRKKRWITHLIAAEYKMCICPFLCSIETENNVCCDLIIDL